MANVMMKTAIKAPADAVWRTISDFNGAGKFLAAISNSTMEGEGVGAVRTLTFQDGGEVLERLESFDEANRTLSYSIVSSPLPLAEYVGTMSVREIGAAECELTWSSTFEAKGAPEAEVVEFVQGVYAAGFEGLKQIHGG